MSAMRLELRRTGGIAGITTVAAASTDDLSPEQAEAVRQLVSGTVDTGGAPDGEGPGEGVRDGFRYRLHVSGGEVDRSFEWGDDQVPPTIRPIVERLAREARPIRPG